MSAQITVSIAPLSMPLVGVQPTGVVVDGREVASVDFGQSVTCEVSPGPHRVSLRLHGLINRSSNTLDFEAGEGTTVVLNGKYSRLWGSFSLKRG